MEKSAKELIKPSQHVSQKFPPGKNQQDCQRNEFLKFEAPGKKQKVVTALGATLSTTDVIVIKY